MLALVSAGEAKTANGAVERMVLLGLTPRIIAYFVARFLLAAKNAKADDLRSGDIRRLRCGRNQTAAEDAHDTYPRPKTSLYSKTYTEGSDTFDH